jgi:hypothetical protein
LVLSRIPVLLLVVNINYSNKIYQPIKRQFLFRDTLASSTIPGTYGYNRILLLPLPDLTGSAVLVLYSSALGVSYNKGDQPYIMVLLSWAY